MSDNKYRKKPIVIEAILWDGHKIENMPSWLLDALHAPIGQPGNVYRKYNSIEICTLEGVMTASPGDWIIKGVNGELYPCKPDIFQKTYEAVQDISGATCLPLEGEMLSVLNKTSDRLFQRDTPTETPAPGEVPADVMDWIGVTVKALWDEKYPSTQYPLDGYDGPKVTLMKAAVIAMYNKMKEEDESGYNLHGAVEMQKFQTKEISHLRDQLTEATNDRDVYKEWYEKAKKNLWVLTDKELQISTERDAFRKALKVIGDRLKSIGESFCARVVDNLLNKYPKQ